MIPNRTKKLFLDGSIDLANDTIRIALLKASTEYDPDPDTHNFVSDVLDGGTTGAEFDDTNYSRKTLSNTATSANDSNNESRWDADDVRWSNLGGSQSVEAVLIYKQVGGDDATPGDDPVIRVLDDSETTDLEASTDGADFDVVWNSSGILALVGE